MRAWGRVTLAAALLVASVATAPRVWAGEPADQLSVRIDKVLKVLVDPQLKKPAHAQERRQAVRRIAIDILDVEEISKRCLGRHWDARTSRERQEFMQVFGDLLERAYVGRLETYSDEKITVLGDAIEGNRAVVRTKVVTRRGAEISVDYRMLKRGNRWRAYDVVLGGFSLVDSYRAQFDKVIERTSYRQLVQQVREK